MKKFCSLLTLTAALLAVCNSALARIGQWDETNGLDGTMFVLTIQTNADGSFSQKLVRVPNFTTGNTNALTAGQAAALAAALTNAAAFDTNGAAAAATLVLTNKAQTLYQDTSALGFCNGNGVSDLNYRAHIVAAVNSLKRDGQWANLQDAWLFDARANPTNHKSLFLNPWTFSTEVYDDFGAFARGNTNLLKANIPAGLTNFTLMVFYRENAADCDNVGTSWAQNWLAGLRDTNSQSAVCVAPFNYSLQRKIYTASNGVYFSTNNVDNNATRVADLQSGGRRSDGSVTPTTPAVYCISGDTIAGRYTVWKNGFQSYAASPSSNTFVMSAFTNALNQLVLGTWADGSFTNGRAGSTATAQIGVSYKCAAVWNTLCDSNLAAAAFRFATDLDGREKAVEFTGSSIITYDWPATQGGTSQGPPFTNGVSYQYAQLHPDELVFKEGMPGSYLGNWSTAGTIFYPVLSLLDTSVFKSRVEKTDAARNDAFIGTTVATCLANFDTAFGSFIQSGGVVEWIRTPWAWDISTAYNLNWQSVCDAIATNEPVSKIWPLDKWVTAEYLATISSNVPPVHFNADNAGGHLGNKAFALLVSGAPWPVKFTGGTNVAVTTGTFLFTNNFAYTGVLTLNGGELQGIGNQGQAIGPLTNSYLSFPVYSHGIISITNTVAPNAYWDSTQL